MRIYFFMISLAVFLLSSVELCARKQEDVVYLKNGSVIRGTVMEMIQDESLKIRTKDGNLFVFNLEDVHKIVKDKVLRPRPVFNKPKGYFGLVESEFGFNLNSDRSFERRFIGATIINGYRVSPRFAFGIGVGFRCNNYYKAWIPIFVHLRTDLLEGHRISPFVALNIGYNISYNGLLYYEDWFDPNFHIITLEKVYYCRKGAMFEPSMGIGFNLGEKYRMTAGVGFSADCIEYRYYVTYSDGSFKSYTRLRFRGGNLLKFKLGFSF